MNIRINDADRLALGVTSHEGHKFSADASTLGFPVGQWPESIGTDMGNGQPFVRSHNEIADGDLLWVTYRQSLGILSLQIFND